MSIRVTVDLPESLAKRAQEIAALTSRRFEDVLVDWLSHADSEPKVESLPDDQLLAMCDAQLALPEQEELSDLLERNREATMTESERLRLDELMQAYRQGLVRKARAHRAAVARGLKSRLQ